MNPVLPSLLLILGNAAEPTSADIAVRGMLESWNYVVEVADDDAILDWTGVDVAYVALSASVEALGSRLELAPVGVVSEASGVLGFAGGSTAFQAQAISIQAFEIGAIAPGQWITDPFPLGSLTICDSFQPMHSGPVGPGRSLANRVTNPTALVLQVLDVDEAPARRVQLPFGAGFDHESLNHAGRQIMRRSVKWALHFRMLGRIGVSD